MLREWSRHESAKLKKIFFKPRLNKKGEDTGFDRVLYDQNGNYDQAKFINWIFCRKCKEFLSMYGGHVTYVFNIIDEYF